MIILNQKGLEGVAKALALSFGDEPDMIMQPSDTEKKEPYPVWQDYVPVASTVLEAYFTAIAQEELERVHGWKYLPSTSLADCPKGLFVDAQEGLCLKTGYGSSEGRIDAYVVSTGEFFWGDKPQTIDSQRKQTVTPVEKYGINPLDGQACPGLILKDDDAGTIKATLNDVVVREWSYTSDKVSEKMRAAREFAEGWYQARPRRGA